MLVIDVRCYIVYYIIIYYTYTYTYTIIIISYLILYSSFFPFPSTFFPFQYSSSLLPFLSSYSSLPLSSSPFPPHPSHPLILSPFLIHSRNTCRYFHLLIYIPILLLSFLSFSLPILIIPRILVGIWIHLFIFHSASDNSTPHKLTEVNVEWCSFKCIGLVMSVSF